MVSMKLSADHQNSYCQADAFSFNAVVVAGGSAGSGSGGTTACAIDVNGERISLSADTAVSFEGNLVNLFLFIVCMVSDKMHLLSSNKC